MRKTQILPDRIDNSLIPFILLIIWIPFCNLTHVCKFKNNVEIIMLIVIDYFIELDKIRMMYRCPVLNFVVNFVQLSYHFHLAFVSIGHSSLLFQSWFMHHFHCKGCNVLLFSVFVLSNYFFNFGE